MSADLSDADIALLCDIGEFNLTKASEEQRQGIERLLDAGYIEPGADKPGSAFRPSTKGMEFIAARGAGLNES